MRKAWWCAALLACACGTAERLAPSPPAAGLPSPEAVPGAPALLRFVANPKNPVAGQPFDVSIAVEDSAGRAAELTGEITLSLLRPPSSTAMLSGATSVPAEHGVAAFRGVLIDAAASIVALHASSVGLSVTSDPFDVAPGAGDAGAGTFHGSGDATKGWQRIGFPDGGIPGLASVPGSRGVAFAATARGIFGTRDGAQSWSRCAMLGAPLEMATGLLAMSDTELWADFGRRGLWVSQDRCATWTEGTLGIETKPYGYDPHRLERYAGHAYASAWDQTYKRNETANRWERLSDPVTADPIIGFALAPSNPRFAYAYTYNRTLSMSTDGGASWQAKAPMSFRAYGATGAIAVHPSEPNVALLVDGRIYRTDDAGGTLTPVSDFGVNRIFFNAVDGNLAYATLSAGGVLRSADAGRSWAPSNSGVPSAELWSTTLAADGADPAVLYLGVGAGGDGAGVYRSLTRGLSWERSTSGIDVSGVSAIASDSCARTLYAGTTDGLVYRSNDGGATWTLLSSLPPILSLSVDPADPSVLLAAASGALYRSGNGGASWTASGRGTVLWHHPTVRGLVLAGGAGVQRSTDGGITWSPASAPDSSFQGFAADTVSGQLFASAVSNSKIPGGFFVSNDGGITWTATNGPAGSLVSDGAAHPALYVVTSGGAIERSVDGGKTWVRILETPNLTRLAVSMADRRTLYAVRTATCPDAPGFPWVCLRSGGEVLRSDDAGASWSMTQDAFSRELGASIWTSPVDPAHVLVGTRDGGVFRSINGGR